MEPFEGYILVERDQPVGIHRTWASAEHHRSYRRRAFNLRDKSMAKIPTEIIKVQITPIN
jgi:hypothetical protein